MRLLRRLRDRVRSARWRARWHRHGDLRAILNGLPALVGYWDADLRNRMANDAYVEFFGLTPRQMRGMHIRDVLGPDLYAENAPYIAGALAGEPQLFDREIPTPSGQLRHTQASYVPDVVDGVVRGFFVLVTDITARREAEQARAAAEARFRALFESAPLGTFLSDAEGRILDVNPAGAKLLGATREQLLSRTRADLTHPDDIAASAEQFERLIAGEIDSYRLESASCTPKDGPYGRSSTSPRCVTTTASSWRSRRCRTSPSASAPKSRSAARRRRPSGRTAPRASSCRA